MTAGSTALELSEVFCRTHGLGASQIPLVRCKERFRLGGAKLEACTASVWSGDVPPCGVADPSHEMESTVFGGVRAKIQK